MATYQEQLLNLSGMASGQDELKRALGGRYQALPTKAVLTKLSYISLRYGNVVVKNHWDVTNEIKLLTSIGLAKVTICIRDPRDIILSLIDHGKRTRKLGKNSGGFAEYQSVTNSVPFVQTILSRFERWNIIKNKHYIKYEDLMYHPVSELEKMVSFLGWHLSREDIVWLVDHQYKIRKSSHNFNKGTIERWKTEMSSKEIQYTTDAFRPFLIKMGYEH